MAAQLTTDHLLTIHSQAVAISPVAKEYGISEVVSTLGVSLFLLVGDLSPECILADH